MRRRTFLAGVGTVALAGCTASGEDDTPDPEDYTVSGLEDSDVYHDYEVRDRAWLNSQFTPKDTTLLLEYDFDSEYDPSDHEVYLIDGHTAVSKGDTMRYSFTDDNPAGIGFHLSESELAGKPTYRVVSHNPVEIVDDFELTIGVADRE